MDDTAYRVALYGRQEPTMFSHTVLFVLLLFTAYQFLDGVAEFVFFLGFYPLFAPGDLAKKSVVFEQKKLSCRCSS